MSQEKDSAQTQSFVEMLRRHFGRIQVQRQNYSLRAFARDLGIPAPIVSEVLRGKRTVTPNLAKKFCDGLGLSLVESDKMMGCFKKENRISADFVQLGQDEFNAISDWYYFAILSLAETENFRSEPKWIAKRLGISVREVKSALESLIRLELITNEKGILKASGKQFRTSHDIPSDAIKKNHLQGLDLARKALFEVPVEKREFSANTMTVNPEELAELKNALREIRKKFADRASGATKKEVYRFQIQFFPVTDGEPV